MLSSAQLNLLNVLMMVVSRLALALLDVFAAIDWTIGLATESTETLRQPRGGCVRRYVIALSS